MSVKLMSIVWEMEIPSTKKFVLLALADWSNDIGSGCYPSVPTIAKKCSLSIRAVRNCIAQLALEGHITVNERNGRSSTYDIHPGTSCTPAPRSLPPAPNAGVPRQDVQGTPARRAPISVTDPSSDPPPNHAAAPAERDPVDQAMQDIRSQYPRRSGSHRWSDAASAYRQRIREGATHEQILAGVQRYAKYIVAKGDEGTGYVQQAATFLGKNRGYMEDWKPEEKRPAQTSRYVDPPRAVRKFGS